jgi:DNA-binding CsgD family transcriptional regulator
MSHDTYNEMPRIIMPEKDAIHRLSPTELGVFRLLAEGYTLHQVAEGNGRSIKTTSRTLNRIKRKLGIHTRALLARYAYECGIYKDLRRERGPNR